MTEFSSIDITTVDRRLLQIAYSKAGQGRDTVFLLHGVTANLRVWAPIQVALAEHFQVIAIDQRGHGNSGKPSSGYTASNYSDDTGQLVEKLGGTGRNVIVGHSLGSRNSIVAAARFPDLVDGIVAIDFTPYIEADVFDTLEARVSAGDQRFSTVSEIETYLQQRYPNMPPDAVRRRAEYGYRWSGGAYVPLASAEAMRQSVVGLREDLTEAFSALKTPTVVVRGAESALVSARAFERTQSLRPDLAYEVVPGADHYVPEEQPDVVADLVTNFVNNL